MDAGILRNAASYISRKMAENRNYLVELDQKNGDGDLGISISNGYRAFSDAIQSRTEEQDLGKLIMAGASAFNEAAPSSMGTITSVIMMGMARSLKGKQSCTMEELADAFQAGAVRVMERTGSKPGEKTFLDAYCPAVDAMKEHGARGSAAALQEAAKAAAAGAEATRQMRAVHGRAAYYAENSIGTIDGGAEAMRILFEAVAAFVQL